MTLLKRFSVPIPAEVDFWEMSKGVFTHKPLLSGRGFLFKPLQKEPLICR
jgi:hypothetical protein